MKKVLLWLLSAVIAVGWIGCRKDPLPTPDEEGFKIDFSIREARAVFERQRTLSTRSTEARGVLDPGEIYPWWEDAAYSENDLIGGYDVEIVVDHYYEYLQLQPDGRRLPREMFPRLVSLSTIDQSREPVALIAYYLTDLPPMSAEEGDPGEGLLNCQPKEGFSGRVLYTTLDGHPIAISCHIRGEQVNEAYLWNATDSLSYRNLAERFNYLAHGIYIRPEGRSGGTRSSYDWYTDEEGNIIIIKIDPVVCIGKPGLGGVDFPDAPDAREVVPTDPTLGGGGSGGGGDDGDSDSKGEDGESEHNPKISSESEQVHELLDSLMQDCMGQKLIQAIDGEVTIKMGGQNSGVRFESNSTTISLKEGEGRPYVLMEELIHVYQYQQLGGDVFRQGKLNREIEAKVGWLIYLKRTDPKFNIFYHQSTLGGSIAVLDYLCLMNSFPSIDEEAYLEIISEYRKSMLKYNDLEDYPEDSESRTMNMVHELFIECLQ